MPGFSFLHSPCIPLGGDRRDLLLTPRLDAQTSFAKLFADIGTQEDVRRADLATLLAPGAPSPTQVTARHVQALRFDLRAETLSHAAGLTAHTAIVLFGSSKFLGRDELGHSRTTVGLTRSQGHHCGWTP